MTGNQKVLLLVLFVTTFFGAFVYLCYLGIAYRMERASPVLGPQILEREAAATAARQLEQVAPAKAAAVFVGALLTGAAGVFVLALISVAVDHRSERTSPSQITRASAAPPVAVSDGCDLAGAIPNCKAVMAELAAKGVKGKEAAKPAQPNVAAVGTVQKSEHDEVLERMHWTKKDQEEAQHRKWENERRCDLFVNFDKPIPADCY